MVIDGSVGAGKSTVKRYVQYLLLRDSIEFGSLDEPVDDWQRVGVLDAMYRGLISLTSFQYMSLVSRFVQLTDALGGASVQELYICERSPRSDAATFARIGVAAGPETTCAARPSSHRPRLHLTLPAHLCASGATPIPSGSSPCACQILMS